MTYPEECPADRLQLCCQAMCPKEMLCCDVQEGALFYGKTPRRETVPFTDELRRTVKGCLSEMLTHPYLREKLPWGLAPYVRSLLLARYIRGDLDAYPPVLLK